MKKIYWLVLLLILFPFNASSSSQGLARIGVENLQENGWHLAKSTGGNFTVELPGVYNDVTIPPDLHMLSTKLNNGTKYVAVFAPNGTNEGIFKKFEEHMQDEAFTVSTYKGFTAIYDDQTLRGSDGVGLNMMMRVKTDKGIYLLVISAPIKYSSDAENNRRHFFNSLSFDNG
jgi:hypothetical protein